MRRLLLCGIVLVLAAVPGWALPAFARRYQTPCQTCHTTVPALTAFGRAFQANRFVWPEAPAPDRVATALPVTAIATASRAQVQQGRSSTDLRTLRLVAADTVALGGERRGAYRFDLFPVGTRDARQGSLGDAYASVSVAGDRGQWVVLAGQASPLLTQANPTNRRTETLARALSMAAGGFSPADRIPMLRIDYFDGRGSGSADGDTLAVGLPFEGALALHRDTRIGARRGVFVHAFRRRGGFSVGALGFVHGRDYLASAIATHEIDGRCQLMLVGSAGKDRDARPRRVSAEAAFDLQPRLGVTARGEWGGYRPYPVLGITYLPDPREWVALTAEASAQPGNRNVTVAARLQL